MAFPKLIDLSGWRNAPKPSGLAANPIDVDRVRAEMKARDELPPAVRELMDASPLQIDVLHFLSDFRTEENRQRGQMVTGGASDLELIACFNAKRAERMEDFLRGKIARRFPNWTPLEPKRKRHG